MTQPPDRRVVLASVVITLVLGACGAAVETDEVEAGTVSSGRTDGLANDDAEDDAGDELGGESDDTDAGGPAGGGAEPREIFVEDYDDPRLQAHDLVALVPSPVDLGPGWEQFYVGITEELTFFEPAEAETAGLDLCDISTPLVIRQGFIGEFGFGDSPDDAALVVSRGSPDQLREFYETFLAVTTCNERQGLEVQTKPAPEITGAVDAVRFSTSEDDIGQYSEALLVLRDDLVFYFDLYQLDGAEPVDLDELVVDLFAAYDGSGP